MRTFIIFTIASIIYGQVIFSQSKMEENIDFAYQNAKKGIYWALNNIPEKKAKLDKDIIADEKLISEVKIEKEYNGVKIQSTGYFETNQVSILIYRSNEALVSEGYMKSDQTDENNDEE